MNNMLILFGVPGCGKGTQAKKIVQDFNYNHISTGDLLRKEVANKTELGKEISSVISQGLLVNDELILKLIFENIDFEKKYILDGFPRNLEQAVKLDEYLAKNNSKIDKVIYLELSEEEVINRILGRRVCKGCGKEYNVLLANKGITKCPNCGQELMARCDDNDETIKKRLEIYKKETYPLFNYYREKKILLTINATKHIENVYKMILSELNLSK